MNPFNSNLRKFRMEQAITTDDLISQAKSSWSLLQNIASQLQKRKVSISLIEDFSKSSNEYLITRISKQIKVEYLA